MNLGLSPLSIGGKKSLPLMKQLEANMLAAVKQAGGSAWYVPDDFLVLGPNIFENGDFSQGSAGWNPVAATFSVANGEATVTATSTASPQIYKSFPAVPGRSYLLSFEARNISATDVRLYAGGILATSSSATWTPMRGVINAGSASPNLICLLSASAAGQQGAFRNVEVREILSAKDWQDSAGTLPSYLSGTVGLLTDRSYNGELGPELVSTWAAQNAATISSTSTLPVTCTATVSGDNGVFIAGPPAGKQYAVSVAWSGNDEGRTIQVRVGSAYTSLGSSVSGSATIISYADNTNNLIVRAASSAVGDTYTITALSVRELKGAHASQATSGNRPTITRIPRKLGPELVTNGDFSSGTDGWTAGVATIAQSSGELQVTSTGAVYGYARQIVSVEVGKTYQIKGKGRLGTANLACILAGTGADALVYTSTSLSIPSTTQVIKSMTFVAKDASLVLTLENNNAISNGTSFFDEVSVREVLEWSYALTVDGSNDSLAAPASIIGSNLSQPYTMIAWGRVGALNGYRYMQGDNLRSIGISTTGIPVLVNNGRTSLASSTALYQGQLTILEGTWDGTTGNLWVNGILAASAAIGTPSGTLQPHSVGQCGAGGNFWNAEIGGCVVCPAVMTDAQRAAVRKFAAAQMGLSL